MDERLSIVIPAYRCAKFLPAAIASALRCPAAEILIAEHTSGDDTLAVARHWRKCHPDRIRVIETGRHTPGVSRNLNRAFQEVRTPFVLRVDGDDLVRASYIPHALNRLAADESVAIVSGPFTTIGSDEYLDFNRPPADTEVEPEGYRKVSGLDAAKFVLGWAPSMSSSGTIFRMTAWHDVGGFDAALMWGEDWELWFRLARRWSVACFSSEIAFYRTNHSGLTAVNQRLDRLCYQYDYIYRAARKIWPEAELTPLFRKAYFKAARTYCGSAVRALEGRRFAEVPGRTIRGLRGLAMAAAV
ncbi:MAG TPA: glycosyltransferase family A protein [Bryobacteraceae bacterium]|nr:glycosyltransferase family A protein [Bryobacteraceae bacterium]